MANPLATILSAAMMLDWLGERKGDADVTLAARRIESAVAKILRVGKVLTPDLGGKATTTQTGVAILKVVESGNDIHSPLNSNHHFFLTYKIDSTEFLFRKSNILSLTIGAVFWFVLSLFLIYLGWYLIKKFTHAMQRLQNRPRNKFLRNSSGTKYIDS
jgi:hypothetical protein